MQRYDLYRRWDAESGEFWASMRSDESGEFVRFEEAAEVIRKLRADLAERDRVLAAKGARW